jgi:hypothetical protein
MRASYRIFALLLTKCNTKMNTMTSRRRKSEPLSTDEKKALKQYAKRFTAQLDCAEAICISREVLIRVLLAGSGSPETISKIRETLRGQG